MSAGFQENRITFVFYVWATLRAFEYELWDTEMYTVVYFIPWKSERNYQT